MRLNNKYRYIVVCEDKQTECFIRYMLQKEGIDRRKMYFLVCPENCGEQFVRQRIVDEIRKYRSTNYIANQALLAVTDADAVSVMDRQKMIQAECSDHKIEWRKESECIAIFIPKRNIETWMHYYSYGPENTNEEDVYMHHRGDESSCKPYAEAMIADLINGTLSESTFSSMQHAQIEYDGLCRKQGM